MAAAFWATAGAIPYCVCGSRPHRLRRQQQQRRRRSSTPPAAAQSTTTAQTPSATTTKQSGSTHVASRASAKREGSAPFRVKVGDNSIPDFGSEAATSDRSRAAAALAAYLTARAKGDWSAACPYLAIPVRAQLERLASASKGKVKGCAAALTALEAGSPPAARADVFTHGLAALRLKGGHGFALFYGPHTQQYVMPLASEGGAWRFTQLAPIAYPLGTQPSGSPSQTPTTP